MCAFLARCRRFSYIFTTGEEPPEGEQEDEDYVPKEEFLMEAAEVLDIAEQNQEIIQQALANR